MKRLLLLLLLLPTLLPAGLKDVLKKIPKSNDFLISFDVASMLKLDKVSESLQKNSEYVKQRDQLVKSLGISEEDISRIYMCGNAEKAQQFNRMPSDVGDLDFTVFVEFTKPVSVDGILKEANEWIGEVQERHGIRYCRFRQKEMQGSNLVFLKPELICVVSNTALDNLLKLDAKESLITNKKAVALLKENGFGGMLSVMHCGAITKIPDAAPWLADYNGASINLYYSEEKGVDIEGTMKFTSVKAVQSVYALAGMGMSFLDAEPTMAKLKEQIKIRVHEQNLLIDIKVTPDLIKKIEDLQKMNEERWAKRAEQRAEWRKKRAEERKKQAEKKGENPEDGPAVEFEVEVDPEFEEVEEGK